MCVHVCVCVLFPAGKHFKLTDLIWYMRGYISALILIYFSMWGGQTQGLMHGRQVLYHRSIYLGSLSPPQNPVYSPASASQETKSTSLHHQFQPVPGHFLQAQAQLPFCPRNTSLANVSVSFAFTLPSAFSVFSQMVFKVSTSCHDHLPSSRDSLKSSPPSAWVCT